MDEEIKNKLKQIFNCGCYESNFTCIMLVKEITNQQLVDLKNVLENYLLQVNISLEYSVMKIKIYAMDRVLRRKTN